MIEENAVWSNYIETIASMTTTREKYNRVLGQIALEIKQATGIESLKMLVDDVRERHGISLSWKTLLNYAWIEEKTNNLNLPDDVTFKTRQAIAGVENPQKYVDLLLQGVSSGEIYRMIRGDPKKKEVECPACKNRFFPTYEKKKKRNS